MFPEMAPTGTDQPSPPPVPARPATGPLHAETIGRGGRLVLAHGFTQTGRLWGGLDRILARHHQVVRVDLPGHGRSSGVRADLPTTADSLVAAGGRGTYLGYSMGARVCLHAALDRPTSVESLVLISGTAGIEDDEERAARRRADGVLADQLDPPGPTDRSRGTASSATPTASSPGISSAVPGDPAAAAAAAGRDRLGRFLDRWLAQPLFADLPEEGAGREERLTNTPEGLASSLRLAGTGTQVPLWSRLGELTMPVLLVTGADDAKYCELNRRMAAAIGPGARHVTVEGAGHSPHLVRPDLVASLVEDFLDAAPRGSGPGPRPAGAG